MSSSATKRAAAHVPARRTTPAKMDAGRGAARARAPKGVESGRVVRPNGVPQTSPSVNVEESVPLHLQVFNKLRSDIFRGVVKEGMQLPGEIALGEQFNVSRITIRRALDELAARGLIERVQGRGTTVSRRPSFSPVVADVNGLLERNVLIGLETTSRLAEFSYVPAPVEVAEALGLGHGATVQMAVRIRTRDAMPFAFVTSWIPEHIGRLFHEAELDTTPVLALLEQHGVMVDYVEQTISSQAATRAVGRALSVEPGSPLLKVERIVFATDGRPVEKSEVFYPADRHQYRITLRRGERWAKPKAGDAKASLNGSKAGKAGKAGKAA
jgi:GntR family transcriptional regulator